MPDEEDAVEVPGEDQWGLEKMLDGEPVEETTAVAETEEKDDSEEEASGFESWADEPIEKDEEKASWMDSSAEENSEDEEVVLEDEPESEEPEQQESSESEEPEKKGMLLGTRRDDGTPVIIPPAVLARHAAMLGSTGSGKTVMAKTLIEEATLAGIPSLILDPQGDLARLALGVDMKDLEGKGGDAKRAKALMEKAEVRIWTPLRSKGLPICIDPFVSPPAELGVEEAITAWDMVAAGFTGLADYDVEKAQGKQVKPYIYEILVHGARLGLPLDDFAKLARVLRNPHASFLKLLHPEAFEAAEEDEDEAIEMPTWEEVMEEHGLPHYEDMLPKSTRGELSRRIAAYNSGVSQLLFANGTPLDIDTFCTPCTEGKVPVNILYLNTIQDDAQKQYLVQEIARELYDWMLTQQPAEGELKLLFFMDEVAPYLPPVRNPPAKELIKLIFKQARKYGVACVLATQNVSDVDYKILAQANTTFIGRFTLPQDIDKVKHLLKESGGDLELIKELPNLGPGQFQLVSPDVDTKPIPIQCRWLYTDHGAPLSEDQVENITTDEIRSWASGRSRPSTRDGAAAAAAALGGVGSGAAGKGGRGGGVVSNARLVKDVGGMAAAAHGVVDDSAFEVRLMGGLAVLKDGRDPLYVMQALTNMVSGVVLGWAMIAVLLGWQNGDVEWWWMAIAFVITVTVGLVIGLEMFLSHDATLQKKISRFARSIQYILAAWLWTVLIWQNKNDKIEMGWGAILLEMSVVWVSLFIVVEWINRFKLGKLEFKKGISILSTLTQNIKSVSTTLTGIQFNEMKASSKQVMAGIRWVLDFCTLLLLATLVIIGWVNGGALAEGLKDIGGEQMVLKPALWLGSLYLLIFLSETWLRLKDN
ncbi:MAG: ATP-binding protein [Candidatus Poseidoniales archaeon]